MSGLNETPGANRIHIAFFGLRNAGKSTLVNAFTGQEIAIVSDVAGTTTDPVSKAMEILPLGPCLVTDTAGLDDTGELGRQRVEKSLKVLATTDIAVWVAGDSDDADAARRFFAECRRLNVVTFEYRRGDSVEELKGKIAAVKIEEKAPGLLEGLVSAGDRVVCVVPIDESAPKGRLILPQQQVIRECLNAHLVCAVCQPEDLSACLAGCLADLTGRLLVVTDSQAFKVVGPTVRKFDNPAISLTSFSVLFARQKGDIGEYMKGLAAIEALKDGDVVLIAEGCTHRRQCNDIGTVKIPRILERLSGRKLVFEFASGADFPDLASRVPRPALVVQCGGCMLTRREVLRRIGIARGVCVPIVNYGMVFARADLGGTEGLKGIEA